MMGRSYQQIILGKKLIKNIIAKIVLFFLGRGIKASAFLDTYVIKEVEAWNDGLTILLKVNDSGPSLALQKEKGRILTKNPKKMKDPDLAIYFKNIEAALLVLTGQIGIDQGFAEHRYVVKGDISFAMSFVRVLYIVEAYLFPSFMTKKIFKRMPLKTSSSLRIYLKAILSWK